MSLVVISLIDGCKTRIDLFTGKNCSVQEYKLNDCQKLSQNGLWLN